MGLLFNRKGPSAKDDMYILVFRALPALLPSEDVLFKGLDTYFPKVFNKKLKKDLVKMMWASFNQKNGPEYPLFWVTIPKEVGDMHDRQSIAGPFFISTIEGKPGDSCICREVLMGCCGVNVDLEDVMDLDDLYYGEVKGSDFLLPSLKKGERVIRTVIDPYVPTKEDVEHIKKHCRVADDDDEDMDEFLMEVDDALVR